MLLDTSGLLSVHHGGEQFHAEATRLFKEAPQRHLHTYVLAEFIPLANARRLPRAAAIDFLLNIQKADDVEITWVDESLHNKAVDLLLNRLDKTYSLCDAVSFVLMRERGIVNALTTDHHFEQEGFRRLLT